MSRRLIAIALLLVTVLQGPVLAYAATLGSSDGSMGRACEGQVLQDRKPCKTCCTHGTMPSCAAQCAVLLVAALPVMRPTFSQRMAVHGIVIPDTGIAPFAEYIPPHPYRPPIV